MGFTRSTTNVDVHKNMPDSPSAEGMTALQLKTAFDSPAVGLKGDINRLEGELEATTAAANIGADKVSYDDSSAANLQAKLEKIEADVQEAAAGTILDNTITEVKLVESYRNSLAKKDNNVQTNLNADKLDGYHASSFGLKNGNLQTNLNAEKLGGLTLAQLITRVSSYFTTGTVTISGGEGTISLGYKPSLIILTQFLGDIGSYETCLGVIFSNNLLYLKPGTSTTNYYSFPVTISNSGIVTIQTSGTGRLDAGVYNFIAFKSSL